MPRRLESQPPQKENRNLEELLSIDLEHINKRIEDFREKARQADRVVITIICCDSRVVLPEELVTIQTNHGIETVLFIPVPTIGSGAPSRSRLRSIYQQLTETWHVNPLKIAFLSTQHGDSREIAEHQDGVIDDTHISCGLRKFFKQEMRALASLRQLLIAWSYRYKAEQGDKTLAPDRMPLQMLRIQVPHIMAEVDRLHEATGHLGQRIPRRLLIRAAYRNNHSDLELNEFNVFERILSYLQDDEYATDRVGFQVGHASYDHQTKSLHFPNSEADLGWESAVQLPDLPPRVNRFQDPEYCLISFGHQSIPLAVSQLFPSLCGKGSKQLVPPADNAFRTVASIPSVPTLLCAMAESAYAILHRVHPHEGDPNFRHLKKLLIVCDNSMYLEVIRQMMHDSEFIEEYSPMIRSLQPEGIHVVNLHSEQPAAQPEHVVLPYQKST